MPDMPSPFKIIDWRKKALAFDSIVFDSTQQGDYWPLIWYGKSPKKGLTDYWGIYTALGDARQGSENNGGLFHESLATMGAVLSASLMGIDKSNQNGKNYVAMLKNYYSNETGWNIMMNNITADVALLGGGYGRDWWYDIFPNILFFGIADFYPEETGFKEIMHSVAEKFYQADSVLAGDYDHTFFDYGTLQPEDSEIPAQQDAAAGHAYVLYCAYKKFNDPRYLEGAKSSLESLLKQDSNYFYEILMPFGAYVAARLNAEEGTNYDVRRILEWSFNGDAVGREGWGVLTGNWNGFDISGLTGSTIDRGGYAFLMNSFDMAWPLVPIVRYDASYAKMIGKWMLNMVNASRFFYPDEMPDEHQTLPQLKKDAKGVIAYEGIINHPLREQYKQLKAPVAIGDGPLWNEKNPPASQLSVYGSAHVGILGSMVRTTNINGILQINTLSTDFFREKTHPAFLYFNPYDEDKVVEINVGKNCTDLYNLVERKVIKENVSGKTSFTIKADDASVIVLIPVTAKITYKGKKMLADNIVVDYCAKDE